MHKATVARTFRVLEAIPPIATPAKVVHVVHDACTSAVYGSIRVVNTVVGKTLAVAIDERGAEGGAGEPGAGARDDDGYALRPPGASSRPEE